MIQTLNVIHHSIQSGDEKTIEMMIKYCVNNLNLKPDWTYILRTAAERGKCTEIFQLNFEHIQNVVFYYFEIVSD